MMAIIRSDGKIEPMVANEVVELEKMRLKVDVLNGLRTIGRIKMNTYAEQLIKIAKKLGMEVE